jgi:hypothetical protein
MRARGIKPGFWKNEYLAECSAYARLLYIGLWSMCDWEGRTEFRLKRIKAELFPYNDDIDLEECFLELRRHGFVVLYDDAKHIYVPNFTRHQNPHKNERETPSKYPEPTETNICPVLDGTGTEQGRNSDGTARAVHCLLIPDSCTPDSGNMSATPPPVPTSPKPKREPDPNCEAILDAWRKATEIRKDWKPQPKMPSNRDTRNLLKLRASEPDFIGMLDRYVELVTALDWAEAKEIKFFLWRRTFDNCLSGEFAPSRKKTNGFQDKAEPAPQADPDVEMKKQRQADRLREIANASKSAGTNLF